MLSLAGKHCIITGGSRGIGLAIARAFASEGASCTLVGRDPETLSAAVRSLPRVPPPPPPPAGSESATGTARPAEAQRPRQHQRHEARAFDVSLASGWDELMAESAGVRTLDLYTTTPLYTHACSPFPLPPPFGCLEVWVFGSLSCAPSWFLSSAPLWSLSSRAQREIPIG